MILKTEIRTLIKNDETGEETIKQDELIRCKNCVHFKDDYGGYCGKYDSLRNRKDFCSRAKKKEELKSDAEKFIDNLLETLNQLADEKYHFTLFNEERKQYRQGRVTAFEEIARMIEDYKEKK